MNNHTYNKLDDILQAEYKRGYEEGYAARKEADQGDNTDYYKQGLEEAWECCRKLILTEENGGIPFSDYAEIFGKAESVENIVRQYTVQEVIQEIKNYEAEQKRKEEEARRMKRQVKAYVMISNIPSEVDRFVVARRDEDGALWFYGSYAEARKAKQCMDELDNAILLDVVQE